MPSSSSASFQSLRASSRSGAAKYFSVPASVAQGPSHMKTEPQSTQSPPSPSDAIIQASMSAASRTAWRAFLLFMGGAVLLKMRFGGVAGTDHPDLDIHVGLELVPEVAGNGAGYVELPRL